MPHQCTSCGRRFADGSKEMLSGCPDCGGSKFQFMPTGGAPAAEEPPEPPDRGAGTVTGTVGHVVTKLQDFVGDDPGPRGRRATRGDGGTGAAAAGSSASGAGGAPGSPGPSTEAAPDELADRSGAEAGPGAGEEDLESGADSAVEPSSGSDDATDVGENDTDVGEDAADEGSDDGTAGTDGSDPDGPDEDSTGDEAPAPEDDAQSSARTEMVSPDELPDGPAYVATRTDDEVREPADPDAEPEGRVVDTPSEDAPDLAELRAELNDQFEGIRICEPGEYELNLMELYEREETIIALQENGRYVIEPPESWRGDGGV